MNDETRRLRENMAELRELRLSLEAGMTPEFLAGLTPEQAEILAGDLLDLHNTARDTQARIAEFLTLTQQQQRED